MKQKGLIIAGCIAVAAPSVSIADVFPENIVGLNLGEISSNSFLNQPFKGVIPFLLTDYENSKKLKVSLAPESVFNKIGAEMHPILKSLSFQITQQNNKAVILISSNRPIQLPFLNFVLEIQGAEGVVYQDYTVLLDPASKQVEELEANYIGVNDQITNIENQAIKIDSSSHEINTKTETKQQLEQSGLLAILSSRTPATRSTPLKYKIKAGDSLSLIAQEHGSKNTSLKTMSLLIYQKNPRAFIRGDVNKIKTGTLLTLPTASEIKGYEIASSNNKAIKKPIDTLKTDVVENPTTELKSKQMPTPEKTIYTVVKGDSLSKITKKFVTKGTSFTKMMSAIYTSNPDAFENKNLIKTGSKISIPAIEFKPVQLAVKQQPSIINKKIPSKKPLMTTLVTDNKITDQVLNTEVVAPVIINNKAAPSDLIKRIRVLRKELKQAKNNLSDMKRSLSNKELLLNQKNIQVESLNMALVKLNGNTDLGVVPAKAVKTANVKVTKGIESDNYEPLSKAEMAKRKHELLQKQKGTETLLKKADQIKSEFSVSGTRTDESNLKYSALSLIENTSKANMAYITAALLLGLLLIRYRRNIYNYTYSTINYEHPNYYPAPKAGTYELKEKNINYHDPKMDEDPSNYEFVAKDKKLESGISSVSKKVEIDPLLVEATEDIFDTYEEKEADEGMEVAEEIEQCENLVTELFDDLKINEDMRDDSEWQEIEKVCDNYIEKVKNTDSSIAKNEKGVLVEGATNFNHMMSDLLESLDKVDKSVKKNNIVDEDFPDIINFRKTKSVGEKENS